MTAYGGTGGGSDLASAAWRISQNECSQLCCKAFLNRGTRHSDRSYHICTALCSAVLMLNVPLLPEGCSTQLHTSTHRTSKQISSRREEHKWTRREIFNILHDSIFSTLKPRSYATLFPRVKGNSLQLALIRKQENVLLPLKASDNPEDHLINQTTCEEVNIRRFTSSGTSLTTLFLYLYKINKTLVHWVYSWNLIKSSKILTSLFVQRRQLLLRLSADLWRWKVFYGGHLCEVTELIDMIPDASDVSKTVANTFLCAV